MGYVFIYKSHNIAQGAVHGPITAQALAWVKTEKKKEMHIGILFIFGYVHFLLLYPYFFFFCAKKGGSLPYHLSFESPELDTSWLLRTQCYHLS